MSQNNLVYWLKPGVGWLNLNMLYINGNDHIENQQYNWNLAKHLNLWSKHDELF